MRTLKVLRRLALFALAAAVMQATAIPAHAQLFGPMPSNNGFGGSTSRRVPVNNGFNNNNNGFNNNQNGFRPQGNWFQTVPTFDQYGEPTGSTVRPNVGNMLNDIIGGAVNSANQNQPPKKYDYIPGQNRPQNNTIYRPPQNNTIIKNPTNNLPKTPPKVQKNIVVKKVDPVSNGFLDNKAEFGLNGTAETDAQQVIEASELEGRAQVATTADVQKAVQNGADPKMQSDWTDYVNDPSPEKLEAFKDKWGGDLEKFGGKGAIGGLDVQIQVAQYKDDLLNGRLDSDQKDEAIANIQMAIDSVPNKATQEAMQGKIDQMQDLNNLGKLAEASQNQDDPIFILVDGASSAGYPPSFVGTMLGLPIMDTPPLPDKSIDPLDAVYLSNPESNNGPVNYSLNEHEYAMGPGQNQTFGTGFTISFDSGTGATKRYALTEGSYEFSVDNGTWELHKTTYEITIDNSAYPGDFHYIVNNENDVVRAGETVQLTHIYPMDITFDRGDGGEPITKRLTGGVYKVGIDPKRSRVDLFDPNAVVETTAIVKASGGGSRSGGGGVKRQDAEAAARAQRVQEKLKAKTGASQTGDVDKLLNSLKRGG